MSFIFPSHGTVTPTPGSSFPNAACLGDAGSWVNIDQRQSNFFDNVASNSPASPSPPPPPPPPSIWAASSLHGTIKINKVHIVIPSP